MLVNCAECGKEFERYTNKKTCSPECARQRELRLGRQYAHNKYLAKKEYYAEKSREYYRTHREHHIKIVREYQKTHPEVYQKANDKWLKMNRLKQKAYWAIANLIRTGRMIRPEACSQCHITGVRIIGHHDDYTKPLEVIHLCDTCHKTRHTNPWRNIDITETVVENVNC